MTHTAQAGLATLRDWLTRHPYALPLVILAAGAVFRFYNLNWDNGHQLHPDERWIFMLVSGANGNPPLSWPTSLSQFLNIQPKTGSPLDPHFFDYGSLPFYLLALVSGTAATLGQHVPFLSSWAQVNTYGQLSPLGRALSGILDLTAVLIIFFLGRRVYGYWTGVLAMALGAFTVLDIQLSHFYAVDTVLLPLSLLTLLAAVTIAQTNSSRAYIWGGIAFGAAMATKTTGLLLVVPLVSSAGLAAWNSAPFPSGGTLFHRLRRQYAAVAAPLNQNLQWALGTLCIAAVTFAVCEPYGILDRGQLVRDIAGQNALLVTNDPPYGAPYTIQYAHTLPYLYQLKNLLFWCMGIPLGLAAFAGVLFALGRNVGIWLRSDEAVLLLWVVPYFLFVGRFFAKFNRYMLPITPVMTLLGAALLAWLIVRARGRWRLGAAGLTAAVVGVSFLYSLAYMNIYAHPNTRVAASRWVYSHIRPGSTIAVESPWDDPLPLDEGGHSGGLLYHFVNLDLYAADDANKIKNITDVLTHAQYIVMSSERMIGSIPKLPDRYPITTRYYQLLFDNALNFRLAGEFQAHPQLGPIVVHDYPADESFHVYDHPLVRIFRRVSTITPVRVAALLAPAGQPAAVANGPAPVPAAQLPVAIRPDTRLMLTGPQWRADQTGPTLDQLFPPNGFAMRFPVLVWLLVLELLGLLAFPFTFLLLANLRDRGFVIAKTIGLLLLGYVVWIAVRLGPAQFDRTALFAALGAIALAAAALTWRLRSEIGSFLRQEWRVVLAGEAVFLVGFAAFVLLRMWYPDLGHQFSPVAPGNAGDGRMGEKQMELAFLNAIVHSKVFPPYDPFFAHGYINYYYYGFYLVAVLCKLTQIVPSTGFNLAIATFFALLVSSVFSVVFNLTRRIWVGAAGAVFVGALGNLNGGWQMMRGLMSIATVHSSLPLLGGVMDVLSGLEQAVVGRQPLPPFDFWEPTRIVPPVGGPISEFPYFTYLFADLHPHLMAYPMTVAALALAVNLMLGTYRRRWLTLVPMAVAAVLLGALAVTNPWDYPTYLVVVGIGALVGAWALRRQLGWREAVRPVMWMGGLGALSAVLYLPFKRDYQTVFATGIGLTRDITVSTLRSSNIPPDQMRDVLLTPLRIYLEHFGFFLFILASYLLWLLWDNAGASRRLRGQLTWMRFVLYYRDRPTRLYRAWRSARRMAAPRERVVDGSLLTGVLVLVVGLLLVGDTLLAFLAALLGLIVLLIARLARTLPTPQLFLLALLALPVLLSIATQIAYVKDWLAGGADYRMNTIFKFYDQVWVLYAIVAAAGLHYFLLARGQRQDAGSSSSPDESGSAGENERPDLRSESRPAEPIALGEPSRSLLAYLTLPGRRRSSAPLAHAVFALEPQGTAGLVGEGQPAAQAPPAGAASADGGEKTRGKRSPWRARRSLPPDLLPAAQRWPWWSAIFLALLVGSAVYTYAGTIARETYRTTWLKETSVPFTLDGMAFMKVAYPGDYAGIQWLNANVHGAQVVAEADNAYYNWRSRVSMFTGLPDIMNGIHEAEQRYGDEIDPSSLCDTTRDPTSCQLHTHARADDLTTLYSSPRTADAWRVIRTYGVRYIFVGFSERQCTQDLCYSRAGLAKFRRMVGHGLRIAYQHPGVMIYEVTRA